MTQLAPGKSYYVRCLKDTSLKITNGLPTTQFIYDGDGGRVRKNADTSTTYIGSLCEVDSDGAIRKHIFAGSNRICTINTSDVAAGASPAGGEAILFTHSDHLGSSNVITDSSGNQVGCTEFTPYGSTFRQTGSYDPKFKFTGKECQIYLVLSPILVYT